jgi:hypothetical protein
VSQKERGIAHTTELFCFGCFSHIVRQKQSKKKKTMAVKVMCAKEKSDLLAYEKYKNSRRTR